VTIMPLKPFSEICAHHFDPMPDFNSNQTEKALLSAKKKRKEKANKRFTFISVSATVIIGLLIGLFLTKPDAINQVKFYSIKDEGITVALEGGTVATLNKDTHLTTSFNEETKTHHYYLEGEANFEMLKQKNEHIEVHVADITIEEYGSVFKVIQKADSIIEISVSQGHIKCFGPISSIEVETGRMGIYDRKNKTFQIISTTNKKALIIEQSIFQSMNSDLN
jgi:ferric-dicitrate binding protein FerR (iron transport regulator)